MTFGEKLYQLRKTRGYSQEALAEKLHTSRQAVSKWENNNGYPETEKIILIAAACGLILGCNGAFYFSTEPGFYELVVEPFLTTLSAVALLSIVFYIILKQNPYRNLRNKVLLFSDDVRRELQDEFSKIKKALLAGIIVCLAGVGISELYFDYDLITTWETMYLLSEAEMLWETVFYMILVGVCSFVMIFCAGVYWSYAVLLRDQSK